MFTGIIQSVGKVRAVRATAGNDWQLSVDVGKLDMSDVALGDSIAVNGVCLTVVEMSATHFVADVSNETLTVSAFKEFATGTRVNLEKALRLADRLGGHMVSGHVDGVGQLQSIEADGRSWRYQFSLPKALARYVCVKGSITINGVSLTVNAVDEVSFSVNLVPHTLQETNLGDLTPSNRVNLEVDMIARYLERLMMGQVSEQRSEITPAFLAEHGFWK